MTQAPPRPAGTARRLVGTSVPRKEDLALLTGTARFLDDLRLPGMLHARILRSDVAHARVRSIDVAPALAVPGVLGAMAGAELVGRVKPWGDLMQDLLVGDHFPFATDKVMFQGQELAAVVAETRYQAWDGCEAVRLDLEELPAVVDPEAAIGPDAPLVQEQIVYEFGEGNVFDRYKVRIGDFSAAEAEAAVVVRQRFATNKQDRKSVV